MKKIIFSLLFFSLTLDTFAVPQTDNETSFNGSAYNVWTKKVISDYALSFDLNSFFYDEDNNKFTWLQPNTYRVTVPNNTNFNFPIEKDSYYLRVTSVSPDLGQEQSSTTYINGYNFQFPSTKYEFKDKQNYDDGFTVGDKYENIYLGREDEKMGTNPIRKYDNTLKLDIPIDPTIFGTAKPGSMVKLIKTGESNLPQIIEANKEYYLCPDDLVDKSNCKQINYPGRFSFFAVPGEYKIIGENVTVESLGDKWKVSVESK